MMAPSPSRWLILGVVMFGVSLIVLDSTVVAVSIPAIIADLGLTLTQAQWVTSLYSVVFAALLLTAGTLGDRFGIKRIFLTGLGIFAGASLLAALATSAPTLLLARGLQGLGGALVLPATLSTINATFRGAARAAAFGLWGAVMAAMAAIGPLLGGWITQTFSWEWIFLINPPIAAVIFVLGWRALAPGERARVGIDWRGSAVSAVAMAILVFGLIEATTFGWIWMKDDAAIGTWHWQAGWVSPTLLAIVLGVLLLALFVWDQYRRGRAGQVVLLDVKLFGLSSFTNGNITAMMVAVGEFGALFVLPLFLVNVQGLGAIEAGWVLASLAIGAFFSGAAARHIAGRIGAAWTVVVGLVLEVVGIVVLASVLHAGLSVWVMTAVLVVYGVGMGLASAQVASVVLVDVPLERSGMGSATQTTFRQLGSSLGSAVAGSTLAAGLAAILPQKIAALGVPAAQADTITDVTVTSAGSAMSELASRAPNPDALREVLAESFAQATAMSLAASAAALGIGLVSALVLARRLTQVRHPER
ncbi:MFS transporter [Trueperella pyogenes]|uniref:MFS transporter n=1 Tax=Trueperella pyogenes TaxID=1661 RepID=UPI0021672DF7|nr:MFS transporter [Trueperella pyogenes]UVJ53487.1 MFS transporter [Trueperella pyogenes]